MHRQVDELRLHPSYERHHLAVSTSGLSGVEALGELAFVDPLITTTTGFIVSGHAQFALAKRQGRASIACLEYELDEAQALRWLVELNRDREGLNDFQRILLALDLEPGLKAGALTNQQAGGQYKGLQKLAKASSIHVRTEIARVAGTCGWNVDKVKFLVSHAIPEIQEAAKHGNVSIHRAWLWSKESLHTQQNLLHRFRLEKGSSRRGAQRAAKRRKQILQQSDGAAILDPNCLEKFFKHLTEAARSGTLIITAIDDPGNRISVPRHLLDKFRIQEEVSSDET